jgi:hypothetical protein
MTVARSVLTAAILATIVAGCGGQSDEQQVRSAVNHFTVGVGQGDWSAACKLATGQEHSTLCALAAAGGPLSPSQCSQVSPSSQAGQDCASSQATTSALSSFTSLTISKVVVSGQTATVAFSGSSEVMTLTKQNGNWLIATA